jgi:hypothetical protein
MSISDKVIPPAGPRSAGAVVDVQQFIDHSLSAAFNG